MRGAAAGHEEDREAFARRYLPVISAFFVTRWGGTPLGGEIEDATQEVFVDCFRENGALARGESDRPGSFRAFLYGILRNVALRRETARHRNREHQPDSCFPDRVEDREESVATAFDRAWAMSVLREAVDSADYDGAFRDFGIDLSRPDAAVAIHRRAIATELIAALDDAAARDEARREKLTAIADFADGDEKRKEIRRAWVAGHTRTLREMANRNVRELPLHTVELLGVALLSSGERDLARQVMDTGWAYHPDSLRLNVRLARVLATCDPPYWDRAAGHWAAAWVLSPHRKTLKAAREDAVRKARIELD